MTKVLIIEDTPEMQHMYQFALEREEFEVEVVGSAGEGLSHVQQPGAAYDCILVDLMLTGMSGLDFLAQADLGQTMPNARVAVLTSVDNPEIIERVKTHNIDAYWVKTDVDPNTLGARIKALLALPKAGPQQASQPTS